MSSRRDSRAGDSDDDGRAAAADGGGGGAVSGRARARLTSRAGARGAGRPEASSLAAAVRCSRSPMSTSTPCQSTPCQFTANLSITTGKGSPYSITERRVPELIPVLGSQPAGDVSHKPSGRLTFFPPGLQLPPQPLRGLLTISLLDEQRHNGCEQVA